MKQKNETKIRLMNERRVPFVLVVVVVEWRVH
jgi:hypothetical protein